jgi:hypothetical protein
MTVKDLDINIKFMQSVELLYLNEDDSLSDDSVSVGELLGALARFLRLTIQLDEEYSGKGIDIYPGSEAGLQIDGITYSYDETQKSYAVEWGNRRFSLEGDSVPIGLASGKKTIQESFLPPDLVICKKGCNLENVAVAEIKKNIDLRVLEDIESLTQSFIKLCCYTRDKTNENSGMFAAGIYFGLHRDTCYVFIFRNGKVTQPCYRFEKRTGIWKKQHPDEVIALCHA